MLTGKKWLAVGAVALVAMLSLGCQATVAVAVQQDEPAVAWWYDMTFQPASSAVHGIEVSRFDPTWGQASALNARLLEQRLSQAEFAQYQASNVSFSTQADLDGDGVAEEFFVGVFETEAGEHGRFVAIVRDGRLLQHFQDSGAAGFSAVLELPGAVRWYKCMQCGEYESIKWSGASYVLE